VPVPGVLVNIVRNCVCLNGCRRRNVKVITIFDAGNRTKKSNRMARAVSEQTSSHRFTGDCLASSPNYGGRRLRPNARARAVSQRSGMWFWIGILYWRGCGMACEAVRLGPPGPIPGATLFCSAKDYNLTQVLHARAHTTPGLRKSPDIRLAHHSVFKPPGTGAIRKTGETPRRIILTVMCKSRQDDFCIIPPNGALT
jgi:hypothetical protein